MQRSLRVLLVPLCLVSPSLALAGGDVPTKADRERDLVLEITRTTPRVVQPGEPVRVTARIVNRSKTRAYQLLMPGGRDASGRREAYVLFTAETVGPRGIHTPVAPAELGGAGAGPPPTRGHHEVVRIGPGGERTLTDRIPAAHRRLDFQQQGTVELRLRYRCTRRRPAQADKATPTPDVARPTTEIPAFELVSNPVRFAVLRYVDLRLEVTGKLEVGKAARLSDVVRLHVKNLGNDPIAVSAAEIVLRLRSHTFKQPMFSTPERIEPTVERKTAPLGGGKTRTWAGRPAWDELVDWRLRSLHPGMVTFEAIWRPTGRKAVYRSAPARIDIVKR